MRVTRWGKVGFCAAVLAVSSLVGGQSATADGPHPRIVGGTDASIAEAPWQVALVFAGEIDNVGFKCGGSILNDEWVVTAAHCIYLEDGRLMPADWLSVLSGTDTLATSSATPRTRVSEIIPHPDYLRTADAVYADVALVRLSSPLALNGRTVAPISLPTGVDPVLWPDVGTAGRITGWGNTSSAGEVMPTHLQKATVPVLSSPSAQWCGLYGSSYDPVVMLCAGYLAGGIDACKGDSGGPLAVVVGGQWTLAGITSFGRGCAQPGYPGIYTRVTTYQAWIESIIAKQYWSGFAAAPDPLRFGRRQMGRTARKTVTVRNTGDLDLQFPAGSIRLAGTNPDDFDRTSTDCMGRAIPPGQTCSVTVRFRPEALGKRTAEITFESNAPSSPDTVTVMGTGVQGPPGPISGLWAKVTTRWSEANWVPGPGASRYYVRVTGIRGARRAVGVLRTENTSFKARFRLTAGRPYRVCVTSLNDVGRSAKRCVSGIVRRR